MFLLILTFSRSFFYSCSSNYFRHECQVLPGVCLYVCSPVCLFVCLFLTSRKTTDRIFTIMFLVCNSKTRGHNNKLSVQYCRIDVRKSFFSNRVVQPCNSLKAQPADFSSVRCLNWFLDKTNFSRALHFC